jgi:hypothetical protein
VPANRWWRRAPTPRWAEVAGSGEEQGRQRWWSRTSSWGRTVAATSILLVSNSGSSLRVRRRRRSSTPMAAVAAGRGSGGGARLRGGQIQRELQRRPEELRRINGDGAAHAATQSPSSLSLPAPGADEPSARGPAPRRLFPWAQDPSGSGVFGGLRDFAGGFPFPAARVFPGNGYAKRIAGSFPEPSAGGLSR